MWSPGGGSPGDVEREVAGAGSGGPRALALSLPPLGPSSRDRALRGLLWQRGKPALPLLSPPPLPPLPPPSQSEANMAAAARRLSAAVVALAAAAAAREGRR